MEERELADKIAYFRHLSAIQAEENGDDAYDTEEQAHRERCKTFHNATSTSSRTKSRAPSVTGSPEAGTAASQPLPRPDGLQGSDDLEIIKVTPRNPSSRLGAAGIADKTPNVGEEIIPESAHPDPKPAHSFLQPLLRSRMARKTSGLTLDNSPSTYTAKRKKQARLKLLPENQQIFRGLRFYYIPNDDANGVRAAQITKARERGATWVRTLKEATHVIVDEGLTYQDVKSDLMSDSNSPEKVIVNANYPIDCGIHRIILNPNQERYVRNLRVADAPPAPSPSSLPASAQASNNSLEIKGKQRKRSRKDQELPPGTQSDYGEPLQNNTQAIAPLATIAAASAEDELSQYIALVKGNSLYLEMPLEEEEDSAHSGATKDDEAESGSESSEDESSTKKKRRIGEKMQLIQEDTPWQDRFACMKGGTRRGTVDNPNAATIEVLQSMVDIYEHQDDWRCRSYRRAITSLRHQTRIITTAKEAMKLPGIGKSLAATIEEIATDGRLRKLEYAQQRPENNILSLFSKIYGVGKSQANKWVSQGYRTLEDLQEKAKLSTNQRIGIERFDDLNERIPRWEVEALAAVVREAARGVDASVEFIIGGSYRRGSDSSGDIDLIITKKGTRSSQELLPFLEKLIKRLTDDGFLTAALASFSENANKGHGSKWHGCCVLPETAFPKDKGKYRPIWRRIDLLLVPETEFGAALIYFTGNDIFNRSIRFLASKKGLRLNQRGLFKNVLRGKRGVTYTEGDLLEGRNEKRIFELLGVKWREPHERWC
ncbi:hypothetical protein DL763_008278 [Monosporascus cannonballus]|nr:hypothetical protein DL763_008278 [Monosporascus cannonballus]